ncbi:hypothetical protein [Streptomyces sp. NPDC046870]|uniref:hypothetical protein n=1 Tax=Streptomyces sp. NPDC046870 TaxID=3155135 RepID=UPI003453574D
MPRAVPFRPRWATPAALLALQAGSVVTVGTASAPPAADQAATAALYVAPGAAPRGNGSAQQPFAAIEQTQQPAHQTTALYLDEGARCLTVSHNVVQDAGNCALTNANANHHTDDSTFSGNGYNGGNTYVATGPPHNNVLTGNVQLSGTNWPQDARDVIQRAGVQSTGGGFPTGYRRLVIGSNNLCLDVYGGGSNTGQQLGQWPCKNAAGSNQDFTPH